MNAKSPRNGRMVQFRFYADEEKILRLRAVATARGVTIADLVREGIDRVAELAEKQADAVERALGAQLR